MHLNVLIFLSVAFLWNCDRTAASASFNKKATFRECAKAPHMPKDRRREEDKANGIVSIGTWNVLFLNQKDLGLGCPGSRCPWRSPQSVNRHFNEVGAHSGDIADVLFLEEVQDCDALIRLTKIIFRLTGDRSFRAFLIRGRDTATGQNVGVLARVDPMEDIKLMDLTKNMVFRFKLEEYPSPFTVLAVHLRSSPTDMEQNIKRTEQAQVIKSYIEDEVPEGDRLILLGDFNDFSVECPHQANTETQSEVFKTLNEIQYQGSALEEAACRRNREERYTSLFKIKNETGEFETLYEQLDHILMDKITSGYVDDVTFHTDLFEEGNFYVSDHFPLSITLDLKKENVWDTQLQWETVQKPRKKKSGRKPYGKHDHRIRQQRHYAP